MSYYDYEQSLSLREATFDSLIMAAMRKADSENVVILRHCFLSQWAELQARYNAQGGLLEGEQEAK